MLRCWISAELKGKGNVFNMYIYIVSIYISDIYVDGLCSISIKILLMKSRDFVRRYLFIAR